MKKDDSVYLKHILDAISKKIEEYTQGIKYEGFLNNHPFKIGIHPIFSNN